MIMIFFLEQQLHHHQEKYQDDVRYPFFESTRLRVQTAPIAI
jgi:hypothetical protein